MESIIPEWAIYKCTIPLTRIVELRKSEHIGLPILDERSLNDIKSILDDWCEKTVNKSKVVCISNDQLETFHCSDYIDNHEQWTTWFTFIAFFETEEDKAAFILTWL